MKSKMVATETFLVGEKIVIEGPAPSGDYSAVFEDDGETGYFYALDTSVEDKPIQDAVHIYSVLGVTDRERPNTATILWSADNNKVALLLNRYPHAVFDFTTRNGYCRDNFPPPLAESLWSRLQWRDELRSLFE